MKMGRSHSRPRFRVGENTVAHHLSCQRNTLQPTNHEFGSNAAAKTKGQRTGL